MSTFGQMQTDLQLLGMASLLNADFGSLLNKCQREEIESYPWSFLEQTLTLYSSVPNTLGSVTLTTGSANVVGSGTNFLQGSPAIKVDDYWLWVGPTMTTPVQVTSVNTAIGLTLTAPWAQPTLINTSYSLQKLWFSIAPLQTVFRVRQIDLLIQTSQEELAILDPSRIATGGAPALRWAQAPFQQNTTTPGVPDQGNPRIELWPRTSSILPYLVDGKIGHIDMVDPTTQPLIPATVLEAKAMMYAARAVFASSGNPKWLQISEAYRTDYTVELEKVKQEDSKRIIPKGITSWGGRRLFDASIDFNHDLDGPPDYQAG